MHAYAFVRAALAAALSSFVFVVLPVTAQPPEAARLAADVVAHLVAAPDSPESRARLSEHFLTVAADYDAYAREHRTMAKAYRRTPSGADSKRPGAPDTAAHCDRLADRASEAATEARTLAAAYESRTPAAQRPASAATATVPADARSAELLDATALGTLAEGTPTPESQARVARHYRALTAQLEREARQHRDLAAAYRAAPTAADQKRPGAPDTAVHCERLAERVSKMADEARALAGRHTQQRGDR